MLRLFFMGKSQYQQQSQGHQQFFVGVFPEEEKQQRQQQHIPGIHMIQMELIQNMLQNPREAV